MNLGIYFRVLELGFFSNHFLISMVAGQGQKT